MPPPPGEGASAWGLFGDADADASGAPSPPRADAHPFFARARRCWTIVGTDDDDDSWRRIRRVNGAIASRVPECAAALRAAGHVDVARQLASVALADVFDREDRDPREAAANRDAVVSAVVEALGDADEASSSDAQSPSAAALHGALLLARGVAAAKALDDAMDSPRDERKARIAVERATALAELATTHGCESGAIGDVRWVGDAYVAASDAFDAATTTSDLTSPTGSGRPPPPLARLPTAGVPTGVPTPSGRPGANGVPTYDASSFRAPAFVNAHLSPRRSPCVIRGLMRHQKWSAAETFPDLEWLRSHHGDALVPVEIGVASADGKRAVPRIELTRLATFLNDHFADATTPRDDVAYVSQHSLLHQRPELQRHFAVPEYCVGRLAAANAWIGTAGTITHLHTDAADNILTQVAGIKSVRLYSPDVGEAHLYPERRGGNGAVNAFSPIDPDDANSPELLSRYPKFGEIPEEEIMDVELGPDDSLFIPKGWWHRVVARTPSFSLNFWF